MGFVGDLERPAELVDHAADGAEEGIASRSGERLVIVVGE
jgi:hypothetical protein